MEENYLNHIKSLHIEGFKKFIALDVQFNEHMNILVGENEAGKSTILDAIKTVLNQQYRNTDKSVLRDLFNTRMIAAFKEEPSVKTLPRILIEVELELDTQQKNASYFYGEVYGQRKQQTEKFGLLNVNETKAQLPVCTDEINYHEVGQIHVKWDGLFEVGLMRKIASGGEYKFKNSYEKEWEKEEIKLRQEHPRR